MYALERTTVCIGTIILLIVSVSAQSNSNDLDKIDKVRNEKECILQGGTCVVDEDCPEGQRTAVKGLCPEQRDMGVECCYGVSVKETRCKMHGGDCVAPSSCGRAPTVSQANDCQPNEVCCVYL